MASGDELEPSMKHVTLKIEGMHCTGCASRIRALLERTDGVKKASASFDAGEAQVLYDPELIAEEKMAAIVENAGYRVTERRPAS